MENPLQLHKAYRRIFESKDGERIMRDLERRGFYREPSYADQPQRLAFNEGRRSMVLHVKQMLDDSNFTGFIQATAEDGGR